MKIFEKVWVTKKKISTKLRNLFLKIQFFANFSKQIVFYYVKFALRMFSAFKNDEFSKIVVPKTKKFLWSK